MNSILGLARSFWMQVFLLLAFLAALDKWTGFTNDVKAGTGFVKGTIGAFAV